MNVIIFPIELHERCFELLTHAFEDRAHGVEHGFREDVTTIFGNKDQVNMECEYSVGLCEDRWH